MTRTNPAGLCGPRPLTLGVACAFGVALLVGTVLPALVAGASAPPSVVSFTTKSTIPPNGEQFTLDAVIKNGGTCTYSVAPAVAGFPQTVACTPTSGTSERSQHVAVSLPPNPSGKAVHYAWSLVVRASGSTARWGGKVTSDLESFHVSRQQFAVSLAMSPLAMSCPTPTFCLAVGKGGQAAAISDTIVQRLSSLDGTNNLIDVSCATSKMCVAIDNAGNFLLWNGKNMSGENPLYEGGTTTRATLTSVSCPAATFCMILDSSGGAFSVAPSSKPVVTTLPSWSSATGQAARVSCSSSTLCVAADLNGDGFSWDGASWSPPLAISSSGVGSIDCVLGANQCVALDLIGNGWYLHLPVPSASASYVHKKLPGRMKSGQLTISRVSCTSTLYCMASDGTGGVDQIVGGSIGPRIALASGPTVVGPSCASGGSPAAVTCKSVSGDGKREYVGHVSLLK